MVKHLIEGSNDNEILRFLYPQKADETRNPMKQKLSDLDKIREKYLFENQKKSITKIWRKDEFNDL